MKANVASVSTTSHLEFHKAATQLDAVKMAEFVSMLLSAEVDYFLFSVVKFGFTFQSVFSVK